MGQRQSTLVGLLESAGYPAGSGVLARPSTRSRGAGDQATWAELLRVYKQLDGVLGACPLQAGPWDLEVGGVAVELDEEQHFNRYRLITLDSFVYAAQARFPIDEYRSHCMLYERECIHKASNRGYWTSPSTITQFGPAGPLRDLNPPGAPRWKQRAFYDFLKDLAPVLAGTRVARIAIWDSLEVDGSRVRVRDMLDRSRKADGPALVALIERRCGVRLAV
jgi:hypothetical protein